MSKISAEAFVKLNNLLKQDKIIQIENKWGGIEITIFDTIGPKAPHSHYDGTDLLDALSKIKDINE